MMRSGAVFTRFLLTVMALIAFVQAATVQSAGSSPRPTFDVVSVKPNHSERGYWSANPPKDQVRRFAATNASLKNLISSVYGVEEVRIIGGPRWLESEKYDVEAKVDGEPSRENFSLMLKSMLEDRFHLTVHRETREVSQYALVAVRGGPKLGTHLVKVDSRDCSVDIPPSVGCRGFRFIPEGIRVEYMPFPQLARALTSMLNHIVVDQTGLDGRYDLSLDLPPLSDSFDVAGRKLPNDSIADRIVNALAEQAGLRLESRRGPVEVLIVDSAEKPAEN